MAFRHLLITDYYKINEEIIWNTHNRKATKLEKNVIELIEKENKNP